ncbi:Obg family GTPase CgtA [Candidatus Kaiserbacteria bacterium RIFCSPHIGHO2_01_FULL_54_36]|uniref:GTPase Obg n=1 Tax=Candidatus Kaiserbacteria bacterium RIFCSPHIGHO2_01_FULL_54_36 TaxID=1798482 RepID=A0A1F6CNG1_9BACT|nr:MAG: Obg family GTPase CgtA [Candidatus Kaiserbacteria bacterium RIFCSPHIGHO2_01_FULL_54_36]OGG75992.1 MAG: Obg family GTPase CgtA [Candidatus Kaiserbacteria bacterium RIFCSPLOWO2_01_FULL_54_22]
MLVDDVTVRLEAGAGGRGSVAFNKVRLALGPTGGDGGQGGSIYFEGVTDINALSRYAHRQPILAEKGKDGRGQFLDGRGGEDLLLQVPTGTMIINTQTGFAREIVKVGERMLAAGGGEGGRGNFKFRSSTNTSPKEYEDGKVGDRATYRLELRLIAHVGLVGLPNAGKSSLLNELTAAKSRVANYAFTTLEPHLGAYYELILADIPGLIEGASGGKGLGFKFLKHIERTKTIFHLVTSESDDPVRDYGVVRSELTSYSPALADKEEHIFLTKSDMVTPERIREIVASFAKLDKKVTPISVLDAESLKVVKAILNTIKDGLGKV